jgi:cysteinyl-tRNA synthetase
VSYSGVWGEKYLKDFEYYMDNDFDTSGALGTVFSLISQINSMGNFQTLNKREIDEAEKFLKSVDKVLNVIFEEEKDVDEEVKALIKKREEARKAKDFAMSDKIRDELLTKGIILEDTANRTVWKRVF